MSRSYYDPDSSDDDSGFYRSLWIVGGLIALTIILILLAANKSPKSSNGSVGSAPIFEVQPGEGLKVTAVPQLTVAELQQYQQLRAEVLKQCLSAASAGAERAAAHYGWSEATKACSALANEQFPVYPLKYVASPTP